MQKTKQTKKYCYSAISLKWIICQSFYFMFLWLFWFCARDSLKDRWEVCLCYRGGGGSKIITIVAKMEEHQEGLTIMFQWRAGRPPEEGEESFYNEDTGGWLHLDQTSRRQGLHAYQGAVYLETANHDDWTFEVSLADLHPLPPSQTFFFLVFPLLCPSPYPTPAPDLWLKGCGFDSSQERRENFSSPG